MLTALGREKARSRTFVFNMFTALGDLSLYGRNVATEFGGHGGGESSIINPFLLARRALRWGARRNAGIFPRDHGVTGNLSLGRVQQDYATI